MTNFLQNIVALIPSITIATAGSEKSLVLPTGGVSLTSLGSNASQILPSELSTPIVNAFNTLGGSVLKLDHAYLTSATLTTDSTAGTNTFTIEIEWKNVNWELIHDFLELDNPTLKATLVTGSSSSKAIYLTGTVNIASIPLNATLLLPNMTLTAGLPKPPKNTPAPTYSLAPVLSKFGFDSSVLNSVSLNKFQISADIRSRIFKLNLGLATDVSFNVAEYYNINLKGVGLSLIHIGGTPSQNIVTVSGSSILYGTNCNMWVSHDTHAGWSFYGEAVSKDGMSLTYALQDILNGFDSINSFTIPASLSNSVKAKKISFEYTESTKDFKFEIDFTESMSIASLTGNAIKPVISSPGPGDADTAAPAPSCTTATLTRSGANGTTRLDFKIAAGVKFSDFLDTHGDIPTTFDPTLEEIDFSVNASSGSTDYIFSTTFDNGAGNNKFIFSGQYSSETSNDVKTALLAGAIYSPDGNAIDLNDSNFPINMGIADLVIAKISVTKNASKSNKSTTTYTILAADISAHAAVDLGGIPIVGNFLQQAKFDFQALRVVYVKSSNSAEKSLSADKLKDLNEFLTANKIGPIQTAESTVNNGDSKSSDIPIGFSLQGNLVVGNGTMKKVIPLHSAMQQDGSNTTTSTNKVNLDNPGGSNQASSHATPSAVGKKFGPVTLQDVNLGLEGGKLALTFTGGIQLGPLFLQFIGLKFKSHLSQFDPDVDLNGFGLGFSKPPLTIAGLFLKSKLPDPTKDGQKLDVYNGSIAVGYKKYQLVAMGSYAKLHNGDTSMFIYGFLGAPLGGLPAILMITGAAAGFGYNRSFNLPLPENVQSFPLIQPVVNPSAPPSFDAMNQYFAPTPGAFWGAIGIRIEAFKMVEAFLLLAVKVANELEIDIIGLATMKFPAPKKANDKTPNLANIIVGVVARIRPERGLITVNGAFQKGSYIYHPDAHLTGAFAMLSVLKDQKGGQYDGAPEGDFVFTMGGYAPTYSRPGYYPNVPRIELNWRVNENLNVKGQFYFALTPNAMMAGGSVSGQFHEGGMFAIDISFIVGADFIIYWQPYHYSAHFYSSFHVTASVSLDLWLFTIHASVSVDLDASLKVWGPEFSGYGTVYIHVLFTFSASVSFGDSEETLPALGWREFSDRLLPDGKDILSVNIGNGTVASHSSDTYTAVDPKSLSIVCGSAIPIKTFSGVTVPGTPKWGIGIKPMGNTVGDFSASTYTITIKKGTTDVTSDFTYEPITKNMPNSLWQPADNSKPGKVPLNSVNSVIQDLTSGVTIIAKGNPAQNPQTIPEENSNQSAKTTTANYAHVFSYSSGWTAGSAS